MLEKITVKGIYKGGNPRGTIIGGTLFKPMIPAMAHVDVDTYKILKTGVINGWFQITEHNYDEYLKSRTKVNPFDGVSVKTGYAKENPKIANKIAEKLAKDNIKIEPAQEVLEKAEEVKEEEPKKKVVRRKTVKKEKTEE